MKVAEYPFLILMLLLALCNTIIAQTPAKNINISINNGSVVINGTSFNSFDAFTMDAVTKLLGKPDRAKNGYNKLHTYDNLGVVFFENTTNGRINEVQVFFKPETALDFCPKTMFTGPIKIDNFTVNENVKLKKVVKKLKKYDFKKSALSDNSYRGERNNIYTYIRFNSNNIGVDKVSFGMKEPKN